MKQKRKSLAVLGPKGTYSDLAAQKLKDLNLIQYYSSIFEVCHHVDDTLDALIPFENTLDGFVMESLDSIIRYDLRIVEQIKLDIQFQFVSFQANLQNIDSVYVQFKTYGQCLNFILQNHLKPIITQSNIESLELLRKNKGESVGAIIPNHMDEKEFAYFQKDILDSRKNETRFVLVSKNVPIMEMRDTYHGSLVLTPKEDKPGLLFSILQRFHQYGFNLISIMSRPRRDMIGNYIFYIELDIHQEDVKKIYDLKEEMETLEHMKFVILGLYNSIK